MCREFEHIYSKKVASDKIDANRDITSYQLEI